MAKRYSYIKEDIYEMLHNFYNKYGRTPIRKDFSNNEELPSFKAILRIYNTTRWNDILKEIGLPINKSCGDYKKEDLIKILKDFYNAYGESPTRQSVDRDKKYPSSNTFHKVLNTDSWNKILEICGLPYNKVDSYSKKYALDMLMKYYKKFGKIPTKKEFKEYDLKPNYGYYAKNFDSMENACYLAGLCEKPLAKKEKIDIAITELQALAEHLNKCPTVEDYEKLKHKGYCRRDLEKHLNMKYNDICRKYIPNYVLNVNHDYTLEEIKDVLICIHKKLKRAPLFNELKENGVSHSINMLTSYFGVKTFNEVIKSMGWQPMGSTTLIKSESQMLQEFEDYYLKLGRIPYAQELNESLMTSSHPTYIKYFGSIENVCGLLDIDYDKNYVQCVFGRNERDINNGFCRSKKEACITNIFIKNNIQFKKEPLYKDLIDVKDRRRFDWKIIVNGKEYYVEYFGLYESKINSIKQEYRIKTHKKIDDLKSFNVLDKCIFIFPKSMKEIKDELSEILQIKLE